MIRGISRQIIEVRETGNMYYGSVYLVVKPEYTNIERELLEREARRILRSMDTPPGMKRARGMSLRVTRVTPPAAVAVTAAILYFATVQVQA